MKNRIKQESPENSDERDRDGLRPALTPIELLIIQKLQQVRSLIEQASTITGDSVSARRLQFELVRESHELMKAIETLLDDLPNRDQPRELICGN